MGIGRFAYTPVLPVMRADAGLSLPSAGFVASANFAGYLVGALLLAFLPLPGSRRGWLVVGLLGGVATTAAMALAQGDIGWATIRFLSGLASALALVVTTTTVMQAVMAAGRPKLGMVPFMGVGVGIAASALLVEAGLRAGLGSHGLWLLLAAVSLVGVALAVPFFPTTASVPADTPPSTSRLPRGVLPLTLAYGLFGFGYIVTATFIVTMVRDLDLGRTAETAVWLVVGLSGVPSIPVWSALGRRFGVQSALAAAYLLEAVGVFATAVGTGPLVLLIGALLLGGTFMGLTALHLVAARDAAPADPRKLWALMTAVFGVGQMVGPGISGLLAAGTGSFVVPSLAAAAALVAGGLLIAFGRRSA